MRIDVATGGELHVALAAGVPASRLVLHGNNKSEAELRPGPGRAASGSSSSTRSTSCAASSSWSRSDGYTVPRVMVRVTPGVEAHTHEFVRTGQDDSKFGFTPVHRRGRRSREAGPRVAGRRARRHPRATSGRRSSWPTSSARPSTPSRPFFTSLDLPELSIGGGVGVAYVEGEVRAHHRRVGRRRRTPRWPSRASPPGSAPSRAVHRGRRPAVTLYTVGTIKELPGIRTYVAVDGGMSDNPRPVLYGSGYEAFLPRDVAADRPFVATVVGKHCESGDVAGPRRPASRRPRRRRHPGHARHRRLRALHGVQLQQGHPARRGVRGRRRRHAWWCGASPTTTCSASTSSRPRPPTRRESGAGAGAAAHYRGPP